MGRNNDLPWINRELKCKFNKRKRLYDHARHTKNSRDWEAYKKIKNEIIINLKQAHDAYCNYMFNVTHTSNCKQFGPILRIFGMTYQT